MKSNNPTTISAGQIQAYQESTFNLKRGQALTSAEEALDFVDQRGFVFFWPIRGVHFPSLWSAVAGDRPVASEHDDPGHKTWGWKDRMLDQRKWYYAKILMGKATMISLQHASFFYALSRNYGEPEQEFLQLYHDGKLSQPAKRIFETILEEGPMDTVTLRRAIRMTGKASNSPFERGLVELQRDFKILPVGIAQTGGWRYSFIFDLVHRYYPEIVERARFIQETSAREHLLSTALRSLGAASGSALRRLFGWGKLDLEGAIQNLVDRGLLLQNAALEGNSEPVLALPELAEA